MICHASFPAIAPPEPNAPESCPPGKTNGATRAKLTVLIPCKNERRNIRECIESVRPIADEILVADSGSTDGTVEIVHQMGGCRVIEHEWTGYADFKNWAMSHASNLWVLIVDADERLTPQLADEIRGVLADPPADVDAYSVRFKTYFMGHLLRFSSWNNPTVRLVRRGRCRYIARRVHESLHVDPARTRRLTGQLLHYSFWSYDEFFEKYARYSKLSAQELRDRGKRAGTYDLLVRPFLRFFQLYLLKGGFLDGAAGIQICMLMAFFYSFAKRARLWEMDAVQRPPRGDVAPEPHVPASPRPAVPPSVEPTRAVA
jgi:glycosyltransferase involved in cell wall biosynthesis